MKRTKYFLTALLLCAALLTGCAAAEAGEAPGDEAHSSAAETDSPAPAETEAGGSALAECAGGQGTLSLLLPADWPYSLNTYGEDGNGKLFGIEFSPGGEASASISVAYCSAPLGICGTGVTIEYIAFESGMAGTLCTETIDGTVWMFFSYELGEGCYISADGNIPEDLWSEYRDGIIETLGTLSFIPAETGEA